MTDIKCILITVGFPRTTGRNDGTAIAVESDAR